MKESTSELAKVVIALTAIATIFAFYQLLSRNSKKTYMEASCCIAASGSYTKGSCDTNNMTDYSSCVNSISTAKYNSYVEGNTTFAATTSKNISQNSFNNSITKGFNSKYRIESAKTTSNTTETVKTTLNDVEDLKNNNSNDKNLQSTYKEINKKTDLTTSTVNNAQCWGSENKTFNAATINSNKTNDEITLYYSNTKDSKQNIKWENSNDIKLYLQNEKNSELKNTSIEVLEYNSVLKALYEANTSIEDKEIKDIYNNNNDKIVMLNTYTSDKITSSANGFFIKKGYIVTTWSYIKLALKEGNKITIKNNNDKTYVMSGLISIQPSLDMAVIKLTEESGNPVKIGDYKNINTGDSLITISSISGYKLSIKKGNVINNQYNLKTLIPLTKEEQGSPVFNKDGEVVSLNTEESINKSYSISIYTSYLNKLIDTLNKSGFNKVETISFNTLQEKYFYNNTKENEVNLLTNEIWSKYKNIGNLEKNIPLTLTKASYANNVLSLRYKNDIDTIINFKELTKDFTDDLKSSGYKNTVSYNNKIIYTKSNKKIVILQQFDYIIIIFIGK